MSHFSQHLLGLHRSTQNSAWNIVSANEMSAIVSCCIVAITCLLPHIFSMNHKSNNSILTFHEGHEEPGQPGIHPLGILLGFHWCSTLIIELPRKEKVFPKLKNNSTSTNSKLINQHLGSSFLEEHGGLPIQEIGMSFLRNCTAVNEVKSCTGFEGTSC